MNILPYLSLRELIDEGRVKGGAAHEVLYLGLLVGRMREVLMAGSEPDGRQVMHACCGDAVGAEGPEPRLGLFAERHLVGAPGGLHAGWRTGQRAPT